jgi:membrane protein
VTSDAVQRTREWALASYPGAVVRRFFELELLDRSFGLAAQAFVALLPLLIVVVSAFSTDGGEVNAAQLGDRFGLDEAARLAIRQLFSTTTTIATISWLAILMSFVSAFSLSRRLSRVYSSIFGVPSLQGSEVWRGLVWIVLQVALFVAAGSLRDVRRHTGPVIGLVAVVALLAVWFAADAAGVKLLVPRTPRALVLASAVLSSVGRAGLAIWASLYMPNTLAQQSAQYGPIGVTFALFTLILAGVVVYVGAPLLVTVWVRWRAERQVGCSAVE